MSFAVGRMTQTPLEAYGIVNGALHTSYKDSKNLTIRAKYDNAKHDQTTSPTPLPPPPHPLSEAVRLRYLPASSRQNRHTQRAMRAKREEVVSGRERVRALWTTVQFVGGAGRCNSVSVAVAASLSQTFHLVLSTCLFLHSSVRSRAMLLRKTFHDIGRCFREIRCQVRS